MKSEIMHGKTSIFKCRKISPEESSLVKKTMEEIYFKPKKQWMRSLPEIVEEGIRTKCYDAIAFFDDKGKIVAYLDYRIECDQIHIGVCFTLPQYRRQNYMEHLFQIVMEDKSIRRFYLTTYEGNEGMISCLEKLGFVIFDRKKDRIDNTDSLFFEYIRL